MEALTQEALNANETTHAILKALAVNADQLPLDSVDCISYWAWFRLWLELKISWSASCTLQCSKIGGVNPSHLVFQPINT